MLQTYMFICSLFIQIYNLIEDFIFLSPFEIILIEVEITALTEFISWNAPNEEAMLNFLDGINNTRLAVKD
ncbi:hypothetical protein L6452_18809 [Arctium lappa]|uniref:Uncharacterized protein n=1 Tax=Arctium lappa TaxID=4217 RepID=A0ACB9C791_ARCLA|nr:hypothetical protein L6452_18809 [Arctium lappa]